MATVTIVPHQPPPAPDAVQTMLGDHIALTNAEIAPAQAEPGQTVRLDVRWYVPRGQPQQDYTTLVHLDARPAAVYAGEDAGQHRRGGVGLHPHGEAVGDDAPQRPERGREEAAAVVAVQVGNAIHLAAEHLQHQFRRRGRATWSG